MAELPSSHRGERMACALFAAMRWRVDENPSLASLTSVKAVVFEFMARGVDGSDGSGIVEVVNGYSTSYGLRLSAAFEIG